MSFDVIDVQFSPKSPIFVGFPKSNPVLVDFESKEL
jgi:hypothetical protein